MEGAERISTPEDDSLRRRLFRYDFLKKHDADEFAGIFADSSQSVATRAGALLGRLLEIVPASKQKVLEMLEGSYDHSATPIDPDKYAYEEEPFATGWWSQAFRLMSKDPVLPNMVYKIGFPKTRQPIEHYVALAKQYESEYRFFKKAYADAGYPDMVPDSFYLIAKSPLTGNPAVTVLQTYAGANAYDLMKEDNEDRVRFALRSPDFNREFNVFRDVTLKLLEDGRAPDIIGFGNVLVVETPKGPALRFVDPHELLKKEMQTAHMREAMDSAVAKLKSISLQK